MNKNDWMLLKDNKIIEILDGDTPIGRIKINGKDINVKLLYLSGPSICDISAEIGFPMDYIDENGHAKSRWNYFEDMLIYAVKNDRISMLLNKLLSRQNARKTLDSINEDNDQIIEYSKLIPQVQRLAINAINNILYIYEKRIAFSKKKNRWFLCNWDFEKANSGACDATIKNKVSFTKGFYILPFTSRTESVMHAIQDELVQNNVNFKLNKSGDIFDGTGDNDILNNIIKDIRNSHIVVADLSGKNSNVYYELGLAHAWNKKVIIICSKESYKEDYKERLPFDIATKMTLFYDSTYDGIKKLSKSVVKRIQIILDT